MSCLKMPRRPTARPFEAGPLLYSGVHGPPLPTVLLSSGVLLPPCSEALLVAGKASSFVDSSSSPVRCPDLPCMCITVLLSLPCAPHRYNPSCWWGVALSLFSLTCSSFRCFCFFFFNEGSKSSKNQTNGLNSINGLGMMFQFFSLSLCDLREWESLVREDTERDGSLVCVV